MPLQIDSFLRAAQGSTTRDLLITGNSPQEATGVAKGRVGRLSVRAASKEANTNTMEAFRTALRQKYGIFGENAFKDILGDRFEAGKSLRAKDVRNVVDRARTMNRYTIGNEAARQRDTHPMLQLFTSGNRQTIASHVAKRIWENPDTRLLMGEELSQKVSDGIAEVVSAIRSGNLELPGISGEIGDLARRQVELNREKTVASNCPVGLRRFSSTPVLDGRQTSVEDRIRAGKLAAGMRINSDVNSPMLLEGLKKNGVEPGFLFRNDWSVNHTTGLMADTTSRDVQGRILQLASRAPENSALRTSFNAYQALVNPQPGVEVSGQNLAEAFVKMALELGPQHSVTTAFAAEYMIRLALDSTVAVPADSALGKLRAALQHEFPAAMATPERPLPPMNASLSGLSKPELLRFKQIHFALLRNAVMQGPPAADPNSKTAAFRHFADRHIVKLDYNEGDRLGIVRATRSASKGDFRLPERVGKAKGVLFRAFRLTTAEKASIGAVSEALANDLTRIAGVPAQELSLVRGQYSDGATKLMLEAKFANGYKDFDGTYLRDGRIVPSRNAETGEINSPVADSLGKYKAMFLLLGDRDAVGSHGQNKGLIGGKSFFAIDPGHSLEGNGKDLEIHDNFSFRDTKTATLEKRFLNFSVFDDATRFEKFEGILAIRELQVPIPGNRDGFNKVQQLFSDYRAAFPVRSDSGSISAEELKLNRKIQERITEMEREFTTQMNRILAVFRPQIEAYDALRDTGLAQGAIEFTENMEKLTSPTNWYSPGTKGDPVPLRHLEVVEKTRIPWSISVQEDTIEYSSSKALPRESVERLQSADFFPAGSNVNVTVAGNGSVMITIPKTQAEQVFKSLNENRIISITRGADEIAQHDADFLQTYGEARVRNAESNRS